MRETLDLSLEMYLGCLTMIFMRLRKTASFWSIPWNMKHNEENDVHTTEQGIYPRPSFTV